MTTTEAVSHVSVSFFWTMGFFITPFVICILIRYAKQVMQAAT